eukprot:TRINITY_DN22961_c0_g1_i1.p1 TRINITY_DN22961_c0_g1~~TRINITY_DN22961_c0_g1_i1.p1  ORF type:complete len:162 (-),score=14.37 TRINITY_DN22961_c0_g1_i1:144-629(-)
MLRPTLINPRPTIYRIYENTKAEHKIEVDLGEGIKLTEADVYAAMSGIKDPEHPLTLAQINVVRKAYVKIKKISAHWEIVVQFKPTVPYCSLAGLIGLCLRVKLERYMIEAGLQNCKIDIFVFPGSHTAETEINKQINDKERIQAALENENIHNLVEQCIK